MRADEDRAHLEWWANRSTCLARIPVRVTALPGGGAWDAVPLPPLGHAAGEDLRLLVEADPCFSLRFGDGSVTVVEAEHSDDVGRLRLSATTPS
ncbi:hypothetical protein [Streptomyces sp. I05A-00742]|uniref:hypothetical protein n=1 Tax=Streptomyces sp. I05A-00742 TaxID=2732853 RepID=UPI00148927F0|nr:hypothetical protein [Streptomyces sp. I05A-00742]